MENKKFENSENLMKLIRGELELDSPEARKTVREMDEAMRTKEERSVYLLDCEELLRYWRLVQLTKRLVHTEEGITAEYHLGAPMTCGAVTLHSCYCGFDDLSGAGEIWREMMLLADTVDLSAVSAEEFVVDIGISDVLRRCELPQDGE